MKEWSNEDIRQALLASGEKDIPVTPTTRPLLLRKLRKLLDRPQGENSEQHGEGESYSMSQTTPPRQQAHEDSMFEGYYGVVAAGCSEQKATLQLSPFYTSKAEVLKIIKGLPGARFKRFESQKGAEAFSLQPGSETDSVSATPQSSSSTSSPALSTSEKPNNFPSLKIQLLTKFRKLIENGDLVQFADTIWSNPRHLISSGDAPVVLQEGFRYNTLHCAVRARKLDICHELFVILESERFWTLVYPGDSEETRERRRSHLIDLYLNMQDKIVSLRGS